MSNANMTRKIQHSLLQWLSDFYFYAVGGKNNYKLYGSVFVHILQ